MYRRNRAARDGCGHLIASVIHLQTPDQIAPGYGISLAQAYATLAYYYEHKAELDEDIRQQVATARALKEKHLANELHAHRPTV